MTNVRGTSFRLLLAGAIVGGCASTGVMTGQLSGPSGPPRQVTLDYETDRSGESGNLSLMLPGGEAFTGRFAKVRMAAGTAAAPGIDLDFSQIDWGQAADRWAFGSADSDKIVALLQRNRGSKVRCRFTLKYPPGGFGDGGTGECQINTGARIE